MTELELKVRISIGDANSYGIVFDYGGSGDSVPQKLKELADCILEAVHEKQKKAKAGTT